VALSVGPSSLARIPAPSKASRLESGGSFCARGIGDFSLEQSMSTIAPNTLALISRAFAFLRALVCELNNSLEAERALALDHAAKKPKTYFLAFRRSRILGYRPLESRR